jgi:hypothetical protein
MFVLLIFVYSLIHSFIHSCMPSYCLYGPCSDQMSWCITSHHKGRHHHTLLCIAKVFKLVSQSKADGVHLVLCNVPWTRYILQTLSAESYMLMLGRQCLVVWFWFQSLGGAGNWVVCNVPCPFLLSNVSKCCVVWWKADRLEIMINEKLTNWLTGNLKNAKLASAVRGLWQQWEQVCVCG